MIFFFRHKTIKRTFTKLHLILISLISKQGHINITTMFQLKMKST